MIDINHLPENVISEIWCHLKNDKQLIINPEIIKLTSKLSSSLLYCSKFKTECLIKCIKENLSIDIFKNLAFNDHPYMAEKHLPDLSRVLQEACINGNDEFIKILLEDNRPHRAKPDIDDSFLYDGLLYLDIQNVLSCLLETIGHIV